MKHFAMVAFTLLCTITTIPSFLNAQILRIPTSSMGGGGDANIEYNADYSLPNTLQLDISNITCAVQCKYMMIESISFSEAPGFFKTDSPVGGQGSYIPLPNNHLNTTIDPGSTLTINLQFSEADWNEIVNNHSTLNVNDQGTSIFRIGLKATIVFRVSEFHYMDNRGGHHITWSSVMTDHQNFGWAYNNYIPPNYIDPSTLPRLSGNLDGFDNIEEINIFPNPTNHVAQVSFSLRQDDDVSLSLSDMSGRIIQTTTNPSLEAGTHHSRIDLSKLNSGVYLLQIQTGEQSIIKKIVKR